MIGPLTHGSLPRVFLHTFCLSPPYSQCPNLLTGTQVAHPCHLLLDYGIVIHESRTGKHNSGFFTDAFLNYHYSVTSCFGLYEKVAYRCPKCIIYLSYLYLTYLTGLLCKDDKLTYVKCFEGKSLSVKNRNSEWHTIGSHHPILSS